MKGDIVPDKVPALFVRVSVEEFPEWVQPTGVHDAYNKGDKVTHNGLRCGYQQQTATSGSRVFTAGRILIKERKNQR